MADLPSVLPWVALVGQVVLLVVSYTRTADAAKDAKRIAIEAIEKINLQAEAFALYRERMARETAEYVRHEDLRRIEASIDRLGDRIDRAFEKPKV